MIDNTHGILFACFPGLSPIPQRTPRAYDPEGGYKRNFLRWIGSRDGQKFARKPRAEQWHSAKRHGRLDLSQFAAIYA
jgi:hypothetical protein